MVSLYLFSFFILLLLVWRQIFSPPQSVFGVLLAQDRFVTFLFFFPVCDLNPLLSQSSFELASLKPQLKTSSDQYCFHYGILG